jgi:hypothetical protein
MIQYIIIFIHIYFYNHLYNINERKFQEIITNK